jgi:hypothetical protein
VLPALLCLATALGGASADKIALHVGQAAQHGNPFTSLLHNRAMIFGMHGYQRTDKARRRRCAGFEPPEPARVFREVASGAKTDRAQLIAQVAADTYRKKAKNFRGVFPLQKFLTYE